MPDLFPLIDRVSFELSNLCNYAPLHERCPASLASIPVTLPSRIVRNTILTLGERDYDGGFAFHNYNEPLTDPRLFSFIEYAKDACPRSKIMLWTNGWNLTQTLMDELVDAGVSRIYATGYAPAEKTRLQKLSASIVYRVADPHWVEVINSYEKDPSDDMRACYAPLTDIRISCEGWIILCCRDWKGTYKFLNLNEHSFSEVFQHKPLLAAYESLSKGKRVYSLCKRCGTVRDWRNLRR